jgi:hypothetical protein
MVLGGAGFLMDGDNFKLFAALAQPYFPMAVERGFVCPTRGNELVNRFPPDDDTDKSGICFPNAYKVKCSAVGYDHAIANAPEIIGGILSRPVDLFFQSRLIAHILPPLPGLPASGASTGFATSAPAHRLLPNSGA